MGVYCQVSLLTQFALCTVHVKYESCSLDGDLSQGYCAYLFYLVLVLGTLYLDGDLSQARLLYLRNVRQPDTVHLGTVAGSFLFLDLSSAAMSTQRFFGLAGVATENKVNPELAQQHIRIS